MVLKFQENELNVTDCASEKKCNEFYFMQLQLKGVCVIYIIPHPAPVYNSTMKMPLIPLCICRSMNLTSEIKTPSESLH